MEIDIKKREEWEAHIHYLSFKELHKLICECMNCDINSVKGEYIKEYLNDKIISFNMLAIWIGHIRGDYYGNFSIRKNKKIVQKGKGFHCRKEWFDWVLDVLPLDWKKIIDSNIYFSGNIAKTGVDLGTGEFKDESVDVNCLSGKRYRKPLTKE